MIAAKDNLKIRRLTDTDKDYALMLKWLTNPDLLEYYEGRDKKYSLDDIKRKYRPRALGQQKVVPCIFEIDSEPVGYIQYYELNPEDKIKYGVNNDLKVAGVDMFIGDIKNTGKGISRSVLEILTTYLLENNDFDLATIDPRIDNLRAIKSYEKAGYRKVKLLPRHELHEGNYHDCWLMVNKLQNP